MGEEGAVALGLFSRMNKMFDWRVAQFFPMITPN